MDVKQIQVVVDNRGLVITTHPSQIGMISFLNCCSSFSVSILLFFVDGIFEIDCLDDKKFDLLINISSFYRDVLNPFRNVRLANKYIFMI